MTSRSCAATVAYELKVDIDRGDGTRSASGQRLLELRATPLKSLRLLVALVEHHSDGGHPTTEPVLRLVGFGVPVRARLGAPGEGSWRIAEFPLPARLPLGLNPVALEWARDEFSPHPVAVRDLLIRVDDASMATVKLSPARITGLLGGTTEVLLENTGDQPITLQLSMTSPDRRLHAQFGEPVVELAPHQPVTVHARLRRRARWFGDAKDHVFDIDARGSSGTRTAPGAFRQVAVLPPLLFKIVVLGALLVGAVMAVQAIARSVADDNDVAAWKPVEAAPDEFAGRVGHSATWVEFDKPDREPGWKTATARFGDWVTGRTRHESGVIVWGGRDANGTERSDGAFYSATGDHWRAITPLDDDEGRVGHAAVWTGDRLVVWGGFTPEAIDDDVRYGAQYDPVTDEWTGLPRSGLAPRVGFSMIWTGKELIIFGGITEDGAVLGDGAILRAGPVRFDGTSTTSEVGDLSQGIWSTFGTPESPQPRDLQGFDDAPRAFHAAAWDGRYMLISGGMGPDGMLRSDAVLYEVDINRWSLIRNPLAVPQACHQAVSTGTAFAVLGGIAPRDVGNLPVAPAQQVHHASGSYSTLCTRQWAVERKDPTAWSLRVEPTDGDPRVPKFEWTPLVHAPEHLGTDFVASWTGTAIGIVVPAPALDSVAVILFQPGSDAEVQPLPASEVLDTRRKLTAAWRGNAVFVWGGLGEDPCPGTTAACPENDGARFDAAA